jgi:hypothetical protein
VTSGPTCQLVAWVRVNRTRSAKDPRRGRIRRADTAPRFVNRRDRSSHGRGRRSSPRRDQPPAREPVHPQRDPSGPRPQPRRSRAPRVPGHMSSRSKPPRPAGSRAAAPPRHLSSSHHHATGPMLPASGRGRRTSAHLEPVTPPTIHFERNPHLRYAGPRWRRQGPLRLLLGPWVFLSPHTRPRAGKRDATRPAFDACLAPAARSPNDLIPPSTLVHSHPRCPVSPERAGGDGLQAGYWQSSNLGASMRPTWCRVVGSDHEHLP